MVDIEFEIGGRKLEPCFIRDGAEKATLLYVARQLKDKFQQLCIPDRDDPLRVTVRGEHYTRLHYELDGPQHVLQQIEERMGYIAAEEILVTG